VTGSFGQADASGDDGFEDLIAEEIAQIVGDLAGEVGAVVEHGEQDAFDTDVVAEGVPDALDGVHEFGDALEGEEFALNRNEDGVSGDEGVEGQEIEGWWAIDNDEVVKRAGGVGFFAEAEFAAWGID
jgi:hypothetical protein